jgi:hypothetical protein
MRELKYKDLLKWNYRMSKSPYRVRLNSKCVNNNKSVSFYLIDTPINKKLICDGYQLIRAFRDPVVKWEFSFSIVESRKNELLNIIRRSLNKGVVNYVDVYGDESKYEKINISEDILEHIEENTHKVFNKSYIKYTYKFKGRLSSIMAYITIIEDSIEFFSGIWAYNEDGQELCLVKYPIGTIVSKVKDESSNFLVLDYDYFFDNQKYIIKYVISKMFIEEKSMIIKYGNIEIIEEYKLCYSKNNIINNILN